MPIVNPGSKVLVSGANGFIAAWVVRRLLEKGYAVRGTIRSESKGNHLKQMFAEYRQKGMFETVLVPDITVEGAFDEAVKGVDAIEHTASPVSFSATDPQELIVPAVNGTLSILKSALNVSSIRRIVITASVASIVKQTIPEPTLFSEADWNDEAIEQVRTEGKNMSPPVMYRASKTMMEKAAWELYNANKSAISWDLVTLNPPYVFGPVIHEVNDVSNLNLSVEDWYKTVVLPDRGGRPPEYLAFGTGWVDVRDLGDAHVLALQKEEAGGERIIISAAEFVYQQWLDIANSLAPSPIPSHTLPKGTPGSGNLSKLKVHYDNRKGLRILGPELKYHTMEETARDMLEDFERRGW